MKTVFITGTTSGLGFVVAKKLATESVRLVQLNRSPEKAFLYPGSKSYFLDLGAESGSGIENIDLACKNFGINDELVFIVNAARIEPLGHFRKIDLVEFELTLRTNFLSYVACFYRLLVSKERLGFKLKILNITTGATRRDISGWSAYSISKLAIQRFFQFLTLEDPDISLRDFDPGAFESQMQDSIRIFSGSSLDNSLLKSSDTVADQVINLVLDEW